MKLLAAVLLSAVALVSADTGYREHGTGYQEYGTGYQEHGTGYQEQYQPDYVYSQPTNNYYDAPQRKGEGFVSVLKRIFSGANRRQFGAGIGGILGAVVPIVLVVVMIVVVVVAVTSAFSALLNSSGRGLDTDEWEVAHSVWMDQLQSDFENSWSTE